MNRNGDGKALNVFTIPAGVSFVDALASGILKQSGETPGTLSAYTILLPTRRACRGLAEAFLRSSNGKPMLLPKMLPLGDIDEDELVIMEGLHGNRSLDFPPAIPGLRRQLLLAAMIRARKDMPTTPDQAVRLAQELARLLDQSQTERLSFDKLKTLVADGDYAEHWQKTLTFLEIVTDHWPDILKQFDALDPAERRNRLLETQAEIWRRSPPSGPVIAAGSTGSIPATADLLAVVAGLPNGALVLPGLHKEATTTVWDAMQPSHPQYGLGKLLEHIECDRSDVKDWIHDCPPSAPVARQELINIALMPAETTDTWRARTIPSEDALAGVTRIDANSERDEAGAIALVMRHTLETDGKTAALVTPDRSLARRVAAELARWDIDIDDSAGRALAETSPAAFLRLTARMVADDFSPVSLLAALKHPLAAGGIHRGQFKSMVRSLEISILHGPRPPGGMAGLRQTVKTAVKPPETDVEPLFDILERNCTELASLFNQQTATLEDMLASHITLAEGLAGDEENNDARRLWSGDDGESLADFVTELKDAAGAMSDIQPGNYPALFDALMAGRVTRPRYGRHPRLQIWGLMEARLLKADVMILGGLNEGVWPPEAEANPWMSRPMLEKFGLPQPERRLGLTAHDFTQALSSATVFLTRSQRSGGSPSVPSRWLIRLETLLQDTALQSAILPDSTWLHWYGKLDKPEIFVTPREPRPMPPVSARPRQMSVSRVETWIRDPYSIYARNILRLKKLDPIDADPGAADRGLVVHEALDAFIKRWPVELPDDAYGELLEIGTAVFRDKMSWPSVRAFWWPRFERMALWFVDFEIRRRKQGIMPVDTESNGTYSFDGPAGPFLLTARADRVDRSPDGRLSIVDYKTGVPPSKKQVESGLSPQLSLEANIASAGGFPDIPSAPVGELAYIRLSGGREPGKLIQISDGVEDIAEEALAGLIERVTEFDDPMTPYLSRPAPMFEHRFGEYDHLARVKEWMTGESGE